MGQVEEPWPLHDPMRRARMDRGWSNEEAARRAGMSLSTWRNIELGYRSGHGRRWPANPSEMLVRKAAKAVGLDPDKAMELARYPEPAEPDKTVDVDLGQVSVDALLAEIRRRIVGWPAKQSRARSAAAPSTTRKVPVTDVKPTDITKRQPRKRRT